MTKMQTLTAPNARQMEQEISLIAGQKANVAGT
jgi:hypothetical protein